MPPKMLKRKVKKQIIAPLRERIRLKPKKLPKKFGKQIKKAVIKPIIAPLRERIRLKPKKIVVV